MKKVSLLLILGSLISCGCPSKTPEPNNPVPSPSVTVTAPAPSATGSGSTPVPLPEPEPETPTITWLDMDSEETARLVTQHRPCLTILIRSDNDEHNTFMDAIMADARVVEAVNKSFVSLRMPDDPDVLEYFGIPTDMAGLMIVANSENGNTIMFTPFVAGHPAGSVDTMAKELINGLSLEDFKNCEETKNSIVSN